MNDQVPNAIFAVPIHRRYKPVSDLNPRTKRPKYARSPAASRATSPSDTSASASAPASPSSSRPASPHTPDDSSSDSDNPARRRAYRSRQVSFLARHSLVLLPPNNRALHTQHLSVLTTVLHACLLNHDFTRARRAFGLLIRERHVDLRQLWAVGVEILLHLGDNGEAAREMLERLVVFYPWRPRNTGSRKRDCAREMLPELLALMIRASVEAGARGSGERERERELRPARIRERIDELMLTPPWSENEEMMMLKGMVDMWRADLMEEPREGGAAEMEKRREKAKEIRREAGKVFRKVKEKGGRVPECLEWYLEQEDENEDEDEGEGGDNDDSDRYEDMPGG